jgi:hypothetical protein
MSGISISYIPDFDKSIDGTGGKENSRLMIFWPELTNKFFENPKYPQNKVKDGKIIENEDNCKICTLGFDLTVDISEVTEVTS